MRAVGVFGALLGIASTASAQPAVGHCAERHPTALGQVACELAAGLPREHGRTSILPSVQTALKVERLDELTTRFANLVAAELGPEARAVTPGSFWDSGPKRRGEELPRTASGGRVIVVRATFARDRFFAVADDVARVPRFWERLRKVTPGSRAHVLVSRPLDAELRSFVAPVPLVVSRIEKTSALDEASLALACGDVDGDGTLEILSVGRQRVQLGRLVQGRFVSVHAQAWNRLSDIAPSPLREPIGSAVVRAPGVLEVGSTDRAQALRIDQALNVKARYPERLPWPGATCAKVGGIALDPDPVPCEEGPPSALESAENAGIDTLAGLRLVRSAADVENLLARRRQADGRVELVLNGGRGLLLPEPAGAQLALGDLDGDGRAELVTTADTRDPTLDFVSVRSLGENHELREAFRVPVPSGVQALAVCPPDAEALAPVVVATGNGLWVIH